MSEPTICNRHVGPVAVFTCTVCGWTFAADESINVRYVPLIHEDGVTHGEGEVYHDRCAEGIGRPIDWPAFGKRVRDGREAKGLGLREVARRAGCSPAYLSQLERGEMPWIGPKAKRVIAIAGAFPTPRSET